MNDVIFLYLLLFKQNTYLLLKSICLILGSWKLHFNRLSKSDFFSWKCSQLSNFLERGFYFYLESWWSIFFLNIIPKRLKEESRIIGSLKFVIKVNKVSRLFSDFVLPETSSPVYEDPLLGLEDITIMLKYVKNGI